MSIFAATIERIAAIWEHPNADRLELARLASMTYQFVIGKGDYHVGDLVVYFPVDSLLPSAISEPLGLSGKLAGSEKNRVKTIKLRGVISQGVVAPLRVVLPGWNESSVYLEGQDVTELLGVTKYEPPLLIGSEGALGRMPPLVSVYDIEGAERFATEAERYLMGGPVLISEKLEGSHFSASLYTAGAVVVCRRRYSISPEHGWYKVAEQSGLLAKLPEMKKAAEANLGHLAEVITVRGEIVGPGIQGNYYKLPTLTLYVFEIEVDGQPVNAELYMQLIHDFDLLHAPILDAGHPLRAWLGERALADASNGKSLLNPAALREGVVIRPMVEQRDERLGRVILKQRSPDYLANSDY